MIVLDSYSLLAYTEMPEQISPLIFSVSRSRFGRINKSEYHCKMSSGNELYVIDSFFVVGYLALITCVNDPPAILAKKKKFDPHV